jgi:hypothetical protein
VALRNINQFKNRAIERLSTAKKMGKAIIINDYLNPSTSLSQLFDAEYPRDPRGLIIPLVASTK